MNIIGIIFALIVIIFATSLFVYVMDDMIKDLKKLSNSLKEKDKKNKRRKW